MANAVILAHSSLMTQVQTMPKVCLQKDLLPSSEQPLWQTLAQGAPALSSSSPSAMPPAHIAGTVSAVIHPDLSPALLGDQLFVTQRNVIPDILSQGSAVFARHEDDLGHFAGMQHRIDLLRMLCHTAVAHTDMLLRTSCLLLRKANKEALGSRCHPPSFRTVGFSGCLSLSGGQETSLCELHTSQ